MRIGLAVIASFLYLVAGIEISMGIWLMGKMADAATWTTEQDKALSMVAVAGVGQSPILIGVVAFGIASLIIGLLYVGREMEWTRTRRLA